MPLLMFYCMFEDSHGTVLPLKWPLALSTKEKERQNNKEAPAPTPASTPDKERNAKAHVVKLRRLTAATGAG